MRDRFAIIIEEGVESLLSNGTFSIDPIELRLGGLGFLGSDSSNAVDFASREGAGSRLADSAFALRKGLAGVKMAVKKIRFLDGKG